MEFLPLLLAIEIDTSWIIGGGTIIGGGAGGALKLIWSYWTKREGEKRKAWKKIVDDKDLLIKDKDERIEELSKDLSRKSDQHAEKIEQLMNITLDKMEAQQDKNEKLLDRTLSVQAEFTAEVKNLKLERDG